jgi:succinate dehydrogenase/fumarate reductase cytochrome b subunit
VSRSATVVYKAHRISGVVVAAYVAVHLLDHLLAIRSVDAHIQFMEACRQVYRHLFVEAILLACVAFQIGSGVYLIKQTWGARRGWFQRIQAWSGGYLVFFLLLHVAAVLVGRTVLALDTNFYFAASGMHVRPFSYFFVPYYFVAVIAIFGHLACAVRALLRGRASEALRGFAAYAVLALGVVAATLIVAAFAGAFYDIQIPSAYRATYAP